MTQRRLLLALIALATALGLFGLAGAGEGPTREELRSASSRTDWVLPNHSYASQRHVDLKQINRDNAANLRLACSYDFGDTNHLGDGQVEVSVAQADVGGGDNHLVGARLHRRADRAFAGVGWA